jgi:PAS domain S-box-containing protein
MPFPDLDIMNRGSKPGKTAMSLLLVDDEQDFLELGKFFLECSGECTVDTMTSAREALSSPSIQSYDAIVSDYQISGMDGIAFLKAVRSQAGDIPFILFTGRGREEVVIEAINNGADFYLQKGIDLEAQFAELSHKIKQAVRRRQYEDNLVLLKTSVDMAYDEVFWLDFEGNILYVNEAACRTTGYSREELQGMKIFALDPDFPPEVWAQSVSDLRQRKNQFITTRHRCKNGTIIDVEIMTSYVQKNNREYSFAFVREISDRKRTEQALRESEERFRGIVERSSDLILILNQELRVTYASPSARSVLGYGPEELVGKSHDFAVEKVFPHSTTQFLDFIPRIRGGEIINNAEILVTRKDGTPLYMSTYVVPAIHNGILAGAQVSMRDITDMKKSEEALRKANRQLGLLSGITRHDILNKIAVINGYLGIAEKESDASVLYGYIGIMKRVTQEIQNQIEFTRVYEELGSHEAQWIILDDIMPRSLVPDFVTLSGDVQGISIFADPMLEKVFYNLLDNSVRHGQRVSAIRVSAHESGTDLIVVWEDNGMGIAGEDKEKVFERGFGKNTGLGMFLAREVLSFTGISIRETGVPGEGARFEIIVPQGEWRCT